MSRKPVRMQLQLIALRCPRCGETWELREYAGVSVADHDRYVHCPDCVRDVSHWRGCVRGEAARRAAG
jgi:hypothetical protein